MQGKNPWHSYNFFKGAKEALRVGKMNQSKRLTLIRIRIHKTASSS